MHDSFNGNNSKKTNPLLSGGFQSANQFAGNVFNNMPLNKVPIHNTSSSSSSSSNKTSSASYNT